MVKGAVDAPRWRAWGPVEDLGVGRVGGLSCVVREAIGSPRDRIIAGVLGVGRVASRDRGDGSDGSFPTVDSHTVPAIGLFAPRGKSLREGGGNSHRDVPGGKPAALAQL